MAWLDAAIAWKMLYLRNGRLQAAAEIYEIAQHPEKADKIPELGKRLEKINKEIKDLAKADRGESWDIAKQNLQKCITDSQGLLGRQTDGDARLQTERDCASRAARRA